MATMWVHMHILMMVIVSVSYSVDMDSSENENTLKMHWWHFFSSGVRLKKQFEINLFPTTSWIAASMELWFIQSEDEALCGMQVRLFR